MIACEERAAREGWRTGIDVSVYQRRLDYERARDEDRVDFVIARVAYGLEADERFLEHQRGATDARLYFGAYHFFRSGLDPEKQAEFAHSTGGAQLLYFLDWEDRRTVVEGVGWAEAVRRARRFLEALDELTGRPAGTGLYFYPSFMQEAQGAVEGGALAEDVAWMLQRRPQWVANYAGATQLEPIGGFRWDLWQHDGDGGRDLQGQRCDFDFLRVDARGLFEPWNVGARGGPVVDEWGVVR